MNVLQTTRVVIVDDDSEEAAPLINALSSMGIGCLWFTGDAEGLPQEPVKGVRLAFLDLRLISGVGDEPRHYISAAISVLGKIVRSENRSVGIVCWTKHEEDVQALESLLHGEGSPIKPAFLLVLENKMRIMQSIDTLAQEIRSTLKGMPGYSLLWQWEQAAHDAATSATDLLLDEVEGDDEDALLLLLAGLVHAGAGEETVSDSACLAHLFGSLTLLQQDRLEDYTRTVLHEDSLASLRPIVKAIRKKKQALPEPAKARLNRVIMSSQPSSCSLVASPGALYCWRAKDMKGSLACDLGLDVGDLMNDIEPSWKKDARHKEISNIVKQLERGNNQLEELRRQKRRLSNRKRQIKRSCLPALLEVSPPCDYYQAKQSVTRFLGGILIPEKAQDVIAVSPQLRMFLKQLPGIDIPALEGVWKLILNARFLFGIRRFPGKKLPAPICRLRSHVLVDVLAWLAAHSARPGFVAVQ